MNLVTGSFLAREGAHVRMRLYMHAKATGQNPTQSVLATFFARGGPEDEARD